MVQERLLDTFENCLWALAAISVSNDEPLHGRSSLYLNLKKTGLEPSVPEPQILNCISSYLSMNFVVVYLSLSLSLSLHKKIYVCIYIYIYIYAPPTGIVAFFPSWGFSSCESIRAGAGYAPTRFTV